MRTFKFNEEFRRFSSENRISDPDELVDGCTEGVTTLAIAYVDYLTLEDRRWLLNHLQDCMACVEYSKTLEHDS